jgi:hypothetical protein
MPGDTGKQRDAYDRSAIRPSAGADFDAMRMVALRSPGPEGEGNGRSWHVTNSDEGIAQFLHAQHELRRNWQIPDRPALRRLLNKDINSAKGWTRWDDPSLPERREIYDREHRDEKRKRNKKYEEKHKDERSKYSKEHREERAAYEKAYKKVISLKNKEGLGLEASKEAAKEAGRRALEEWKQQRREAIELGQRTMEEAQRQEDLLYAVQPPSQELLRPPRMSRAGRKLVAESNPAPIAGSSTGAVEQRRARQLRAQEAGDAQIARSMQEAQGQEGGEPYPYGAQQKPKQSSSAQSRIIDRFSQEERDAHNRYTNGARDSETMAAYNKYIAEWRKDNPARAREISRASSQKIDKNSRLVRGFINEYHKVAVPFKERGTRFRTIDRILGEALNRATSDEQRERILRLDAISALRKARRYNDQGKDRYISSGEEA